jgi:DNA-directed RNA polymerase beta subunit
MPDARATEAAVSDADVAALLKEWGSSPERLATMFCFPHFIDPTRMVRESADTFSAQLTSLLRVFELEARYSDGQRVRTGRLTFTSAGIRRPTVTMGGHAVPDTPYNARTAQRDYTAPIYVSAALTVTETSGKQERVFNSEARDLYLGDVPQVVRGGNCTTAGMSGAMLEEVGESASDPGGYVILKGNPTAVRIMEFLIYNQFTVHLRHNRPEKVQGQVISKRGDAYENSAQMQIRVMQNDEITIELAYAPFKDMLIPFYLLYRVMGVPDDEQILKMVLYDPDDPSSQTQELRAVVVKALSAPPPGSDWRGAWECTNPAELMAYLGWRSDQSKGRPGRAGPNWAAFVEGTTPDSRKTYADLTRKMLAKYFLLHAGDSAGDADYPRKLHHMTYYLRQVLLTLIGVLEPTDRESYAHKRWHALEVQFSKIMKTIFNLRVARAAQKALEGLLKTAPDAASITVRAVLDPLLPAPALAAELSKAMQRAEKSRPNGVPASMSTERITPKNARSGPAAIMTIRTPGNTSKQTERADKQRRVHGTYPGTVCPIRSAESGEQVGMNKGPPCLAVISRASSSAELQVRVAADPLLVPVADIDADFSRVPRERLAPVLVNGLIVGYSARPLDCYRRWRDARRRGEIDRRCTIQMNPMTGEVSFFTDFGRPLFPYVVVENNEAEREADPSLPFRQWPAVGRAEIADLLAGRTSIDALEQVGKIEYLNAGEVLSLCYVAPTVEDLAREASNPLHSFTHMYVHPSSIFSHSGLLCVYPTQSAQARNTYQTQQGKGAQGVTFTNPHQHFARGGGKQQPYVHEPIIGTIANAIFTPAGQNVMLAILASNGLNMEDSCTAKRQAIERGLFNLYSYEPFEVTLRKSDVFANPVGVRQRAVARIADANYDYLDENGLIRLGSPVVDGTVLIGVLETVTDAGAQSQVDRSVVYRGTDRGVVVNVIDPRASGDTRHCKVIVLSPRFAEAGEKLAARSGNKAIVCAVIDERDLPYTRDGVRPDIVMSPLSFPTRMVINQLLEAAEGLLCARRGATADATAFNATATRQLYDELLRVARADVSASADPDATAFALFGEAAAAVEKYSLDDDAVRSKFSGLSTVEMFDPETGCAMRGITMTPLFLRRLAKFASDDVYAVGKGAQNLATRQPAGGKRQHGGLKFGEMERETLKAHGSSFFMSEKFMVDSSGRPMFVCARCNQFTGVVNEPLGVWSCPRCESNADVQRVAGDWGTHVLQQTLHCIGVGMQVIPRPVEIPRPASPSVAAGDAFAFGE